MAISKPKHPPLARNDARRERTNDLVLDIAGLNIVSSRQPDAPPLLKGLTLRLQRGEVLGLIGESGAGKSTLGLAALGYQRTGCRYDKGVVRFDDLILQHNDEAMLSSLRGVRMAYVAQSAAAAFNPAHRLGAQITEGARCHATFSRQEAKRRMVSLFRRFDLPEPDRFGDRFPHQASGGQLQRAMIVMAMLCEPQLIVFDEPTTALDVTTQIEVLATIKKNIRAQGSTSALYITHDLAVVAQVADRIMVLKDGMLVEENETSSLLTKPQRPYTKELLSVYQVQRPRGRGTKKGAGVLLRGEGLDAGYGGGTRILEGVRFDVSEHEILGVVGESGCGKSTLARVVTGLLPSREGSLWLGGEELPRRLKRRSKEQLRRVQLVSQIPDSALNPRQKIREALGRPLSYFFPQRRPAEREHRLNELLSSCELDLKVADAFPAELSGGQKQRVCIARALAAEPDIIVCDEITSALDRLIAKGIVELMLDLQKKLGMAYIFISHDLGLVRAISDDIMVMQGGRVLSYGAGSEIEKSKDAYTQKLLRSVPQMRVGWLDEVLQKRG